MCVFEGLKLSYCNKFLVGLYYIIFIVMLIIYYFFVEFYCLYICECFGVEID